MNKTVAITVISILAVGVIAATWFSADQSGKLHAAETAMASEGTRAAATSTAGAQVQMSTATSFALTKAAQISTLSVFLDEKSRELKRVEQIALCPKIPPDGINYTSNSTVSASLKKWVNTQDKVRDASWYPVWNNSDVTIHNLNGEFLYVFVVYFDEPSMGYTNSVYSVGQSCFIDY